jgi:MFS family permease
MGTILGTNTIFYGIGGALGAFIAGHIFDTTGSYLIAFSLAAITMILTTVVALLLKKPKLKSNSSPGEIFDRITG